MIRVITFIYDFLLILKAEIKRDYIFLKRYPLEIVSFIFFMYIILLAVFFGFSQLTIGTVNLLNREKMIIGYCLMQFVLSTQMGWSGQIQNESQTGTLEQLSISGHTLGEVLLARGLAQLPRQIFSFYVLLFLYKISIPDLQIGFNNNLYILLNMFVMAIGIFGVSYIFAGVTLIFKRVGFFFQIVNFAFLGLFWQDRSKLVNGGLFAALYDHFPLTMGMANLQKILINQYVQLDFSELSMFHFVLNSLIFAILGYYLFNLMEKKARTLGLLSQY